MLSILLVEVAINHCHPGKTRSLHSLVTALNSVATRLVSSCQSKVSTTLIIRCKDSFGSHKILGMLDCVLADNTWDTPSRLVYAPNASQPGKDSNMLDAHFFPIKHIPLTPSRPQRNESQAPRPSNTPKRNDMELQAKPHAAETTTFPLLLDLSGYLRRLDHCQRRHTSPLSRSHPSEPQYAPPLYLRPLKSLRPSLLRPGKTAPNRLPSCS